MAPTDTLPIRASRLQVSRFLLLILLLNIGFMLTTALKYTNVLSMGGRVTWRYVVARACDLGAENNVAAWYSAITLLIAAGVWVICYALDLRGRKPGWDRILCWGWLLLAVLFCLLSLDEEGSFHERLGAVPGMNQFEVFVAPMVLVGIFLLAFAWARLRGDWLTIGLLALGFLTYLSVPIQERAETILEKSGIYTATWHTPARDVVIEEGSELLGTLFFIAAGLVQARRLNRARVSSMPENQWLDFEVPVSPPVVGRVLGSVVGLLGLGFVIAQFVAVPDLPHGSQFTYSELGSPPDWFAASLMLITGSVFLYAARVKSAAGEQQLRRSFYTIFAVFAFVLSIHHGGGHLLSDIVWAGSPRRQIATNVLLALACLAVGGVGIARLSRTGSRWSMAVWTVLVAGAAVLPEPGASMLLFLGYGLVLVGIAPTALVPGTP